MKIKTISRSAEQVQAAGSTVAKLPRNLDPALHPFEKAREYTRALNATKLERMFAAPFIGQLGAGHVDGVYSLAQDPGSLERTASGSGDGVVKVWDLPSRAEVWQAKAHKNIVRGLTWTPDRKILTCGADQTVKLYDPYSPEAGSEPLGVFQGSSGFSAISHHRDLSSFAVSSSQISIYDTTRPSSAPTQTLHWPSSVDTITNLAFNKTETSILASCGTDRSVILYDVRTSSPLHRNVLSFATNSIAWNAMEAFNFATGSEDHNVYIFDMRNMSRALNILKGHVGAVMSVSFSPTGEGLVSGSYDRTLRLWDRSKGHSRDVYHTQRMQRIFSVSYVPDNNYVLSGSDDGNVRLWRANASARQGIKSAREREKLEYDEALKQRYGHMPEIRRIARHRHVPKVVREAGKIKKVELDSIKRRKENERRNTKRLRDAPRKSEREKMVLKNEE